MASSCGSPNTGGAKIGRPAQWTPSKSRKLARLYVYTVLPVEQIIKAVFRDDDNAVKKNSAQKTMHKLFGPDPRSLRPADRNEQNTRFKVWRNWNERRRSSGTTVEQHQDVTGLKFETATPAPSSHAEPFDDADTLSSPQQDMHERRFDVASPTSTLALSPEGPIFSAFPKDDDAPVFQFPRRPLRNDTSGTASTQISTRSVLSLKERLGVSTFFAKQIGLIMRFTAGSTENLATLTAHRTPSDIPSMRRGYCTPVPHPGLAVPGDFMVAPKYVHSCQKQRHFAQYLQESKCECWCTISDETTDEMADNFYVTAKGEMCDRASTERYNVAGVIGVDTFGNTLAHLFAALETQQSIEATIHLVRSRGKDSLLANKADQTFLHVLSSVWFTGLNDLKAPLYELLDELFHQGVSGEVFHRDVYGRTFFHQLDRYCTDAQDFHRIARHYHGSVIPRDAFGVQPPSHIGEHSLHGPRRVGTTPLSPLAEELTDQDVAELHQKLIAVVNAAYDDPSVEDDEGRNGLQCLAVLKLGTGPLPPSNPSSPNPNQPSNPNKRKRGKEDGIKTIDTRAQYLENLLMPTASARPPDVNHYDKKGMTVLMAFAAYLADEQDKSGLVIGKIIDILLANGAKLDARNRQGETALLIAARHGNKHVVSKLLDRGANFHARDKSGRGIMAIIDCQIAESPGDLPLYGRLEAVRAAVVAKKLGENGGQDEPSFLDEWCRVARSQI